MNKNTVGILKNIETLEWLDVAPIFDNRQSLNIIGYDDNELIINGQGKLFYEVDSFDKSYIVCYNRNIL